MMYKKIIAIAVLAVAVLSCNQGAGEKETPKTDSAKPEMRTSVPPAAEKKFAGLAFANTKDYICGMPVTAGVEDTVSYKGKLYGFCSKECKDEFMKDPQPYVAGTK